MKTLANVVLFVALISLSSGSQADLESLDGFVERGMDLWQVPGMSVAVVDGERVHFQRGFGVTSIENGVAVDEHTQFAIASTTKAMVAAAVMILVDDGKAGLDDPVIQHLPELHFSDPMITEQITVRDLLTHRTGLPSTDIWTFMMGMPLPEQVSRLSSVPFDEPTRSGFIYQNTMYELAGLLIERLSGKPWEQFVSERLWQPIGMNETHAARGRIPDSLEHVMPHDEADGEVGIVDWDLDADLADAAGSVWSSVHDMSLWAQFLLRGGINSSGDRLISEESFTELFIPQQLIRKGNFYPASELSDPNWRSYGLGWFQQDFQGRKIDFHTGSLSGLIAIVGLDRAGDKAVIVLGNRDHAEMRHALMWHVLDGKPPEERRDWNQEVFDLYQSNAESSDDRWAELEQKRLRRTKPSLDLEQYSGHYRNAALGDISIVRDGRKLSLRLPKLDMAMSHWHLDTFLVEHPPWGLKEFATFHVGPEGEIVSMSLFELDFEAVTEEP